MIERTEFTETLCTGSVLGVDFQLDLSIAGGALVLNNTQLVIQNSQFVGLGNDGSQAPVWLFSSSVIFNNVTFLNNVGAVAGMHPPTQ